MQKLTMHRRCPECEDTLLIEDGEMGEIVCSRCGLVIREKTLNQGPEWTAFSIEEKISRSRTGSPLTLSRRDKGLSTVIPVDRDASGHPLSPETKRRMRRLRRWQYKVEVANSQNIIRAMSELDRLSEKSNVPHHIRETAAIIYRKALKRELLRGRRIATSIAASLYMAYRLAEIPRSIKEIADASQVGRIEIGRYYRLLQRELAIRIPFDHPSNHVAKIAEATWISGDVQTLALKILRKAERKGITAGNPRGVAAAGLYIACAIRKQTITERELAEAANLTEVTIRNRKKEIAGKLGLKI